MLIRPCVRWRRTSANLVAARPHAVSLATTSDNLNSGLYSDATGVARRPPAKVPTNVRRLIMGSRYRQRESERRSLAHLALHPDPSPMQLNELPGQGQPEPGPLDLLVRHAHLPELLEDRLLILWRDAHTGVGDGNLGHAVVHRGAYVDPAALWRELEGVGEQVQEDLLHLALIAPDHAHAVVDGPPEGDPSPARSLANEDQGIVDRHRQAELRHLQLHASCFDL